MRNSLYLYMVLLAVCVYGLVGCVPEDEFSLNGMRINIGAKVTSAVLSRTEANFVDYNTNTDLPITMIRWDQSNVDNTVSAATELGAKMGSPASDGTWLRKIEFSSSQFYKNKQDYVGFAGWYPAADAEGNGWVKSDGKVIASDNTMTYNLDGTTDVMISDFSKGNFQEGIPALTFKHALCMYNIYAYAVDGDCVKEWGKLSQVTLSNLHKQLKITLPGRFTDMWEPAFTYHTPVGVGGQTEYENYGLMDGVPAMELPVGMQNAIHVGTLLQGVPAGFDDKIQDGVLYIESETEGQNESVTVAIVRDFTPGHAYNIYLKFSTKGIINAEVSGTDWVYDENKDYEVSQDYGLLTDLSRYGTANCYIVSSANRGYCFDATVKGNGVNTLTKRDGTTIVLPDRDTRLDIDTVAILRSDAMMKMDGNGKMVYIDNATERVSTPIIKLLSNKLTDGKIVFEVPGNKNNKDDYSLIYRGNVKIAGYKNGEIVWSWHIWVTDKPQNQGYSNGYVALDRNLGAVTKDYANFKPARSHWSGLYYQWGRKDPIFRPTVDDNTEWNNVWKPEVVESPVPVADAHKRPTAYYYDASGASNNWTTDTENNDYFWGYISMRDDVKKTLYDPCPPGYRVPGNALWENYISDMTAERVNNSGGEFAGYNFNIYGMMDIYYPGAVCLADGKLQNSDDMEVSEIENFTYMYSATPYDPDIYGQGDNSDYQGLAYHFRYNKDKIGTDYSSVMVADPTKYHVKRSAAYPVRCVFESSSPTVTDLSEVQTANSYMVTKSGFYKFRATTRGNGVTGLYVVQKDGPSFFRSFDAGMGANITGIDKVDVLWWQGDLTSGSSYRSFADNDPTSAEIEKECPVVILDNGELDNDFVTFYVTANQQTYGNVGLAAYDANGNILWSWHIWILPEVYDVRLGEYTVMDRNLGATYAPTDETGINQNNFYANLGLYYQWGRKDPFFSPRNDNTYNRNTYYWFRKQNGVWTKQENNMVKYKGTIQKSVEEPNSYYQSDNSFWQTTYEDYNGAANDLWGYVGRAGDLGDSFAKTMYDPCPPGYRVMQHDVFETAGICYCNASANDESDYTIQNYNNAYGIYFTDGMSAWETISAGGIWFPNSVAMDKDGNFQNHSDFRLSTSTPYYSNGTLNTRENRWWKDGNNYKIKSDKLHNWMMDGRVVRCQME